MSEKRRPTIKLIAQVKGKKRLKVELYPGSLWPDKFGSHETRYRVRVNGKWAQGASVFTITVITKQLRSLLTTNRQQMHKSAAQSTKHRE